MFLTRNIHVEQSSSGGSSGISRIGDIFGDGSNLYTSDFYAGTLSSVESGITYQGYTNTAYVDENNPAVEDNSIVVFRNDLPSGRSGFGKSIALSNTTDYYALAFEGPTPENIRTTSFWVYVDEHDDDNNHVLNVNLRRNSTTEMWVTLWAPDITTIAFSKFNAVSEDSWHHIVVTKRSDNNVYTYQNGTLLGSTAVGNKIPRPSPPYNTAPSAKMDLMAQSDADASNKIWMTGARMFNRAVTASEVTTLYNENPS